MAEQPPAGKPIAVVPAVFDQAVMAIKEKRFDAAENFLNQSIARNENALESQALLGEIFKQQRRYREAITVLDRAIQLDPQAQQYFSRAECQAMLGESDNALADFTKAAEVSPSDLLFTNKRYLFMIEHGQSQAVRDMIKAQMDIGLESTMNTWVMAAAALALEDGKNVHASIILKKAMSILPPKEFFYLLQASVFQAWRNNPEIMPFFLKAASDVKKSD